jgi:hypothetical protein
VHVRIVHALDTMWHTLLDHLTVEVELHYAPSYPLSHAHVPSALHVPWPEQVVSLPGVHLAATPEHQLSPLGSQQHPLARHWSLVIGVPGGTHEVSWVPGGACSGGVDVSEVRMKQGDSTMYCSMHAQLALCCWCNLHHE